MSGENLRKIQPASGKTEVCRFSTLVLSNTQCLLGHFASTRCQQSLEPCLRLLLWSGGEWEGIEPGVWQIATSSWHAVMWELACVPLLFYRQRNYPVGTLLKIYDKNILKIDSILRLTCFYDMQRNFLTFSLAVCSRVMNLDYWAEHTNKKEVFGHKLRTLSNKSNIDCGTGIPRSAFWWRSSKVSEYL